MATYCGFCNMADPSMMGHFPDCLTPLMARLAPGARLSRLVAENDGLDDPRNWVDFGPDGSIPAIYQGRYTAIYPADERHERRLTRAIYALRNYRRNHEGA